MRLFRSEDELDEWCAAQGRPRGGLVQLARLHQLAADWYGDRLDPGWHPRSTAASQRLLARAGLTGDFWRLA